MRRQCVGCASPLAHPVPATCTSPLVHAPRDPAAIRALQPALPAVHLPDLNEEESNVEMTEEETTPEPRTEELPLLLTTEVWFVAGQRPLCTTLCPKSAALGGGRTGDVTGSRPISALVKFAERGPPREPVTHVPRHHEEPHLPSFHAPHG